MKRKVLILMPSMFIGGAERSLLGLMEAFDYKKYEVNLFLYRHEGEFLSLIPKEVNILPAMKQYAIFDVPIKTLFSVDKLRYGLRRLFSKIAIKVHCVFSGEPQGVWMKMQYISKYLQKLLPDIPGEYDVGISFLGVPDVLVNKVHAKIKLAWNHTDYTILGPNKKYDRQVYEKIDYIVSVSEQCMKQFLKVYPELQSRAVVIENVLSTQMLWKQSMEPISDMEARKGEIRLLSIGRYSEAKNFDNVPHICKIIRDSGLNVKWFIIGYGAEEALIRQKIAETGMEQYVLLLGRKNNPYPYIKKCDLYVQPSRYEGKSVTVREAQTLCKPVVITRFATATSQLEDGVDGIIVPIENEACAEGITNVLRNTRLLENLISNTRQRDYSNQKEMRQLYDLFDSLL
ncbi:MAG: glycosyltransferase [Oliverpabstia sp.]